MLNTTNREKYWSFHCKVCAFEIYHIEQKISASEVFQINALTYWFRYSSVICVHSSKTRLPV